MFKLSKYERNVRQFFVLLQKKNTKGDYIKRGLSKTAMSNPNGLLSQKACHYLNQGCTLNNAGLGKLRPARPFHAARRHLRKLLPCRIYLWNIYYFHQNSEFYENSLCFISNYYCI